MALDIRALIFDLDGVITDTAELHYQSWKRLSEEEGIPFTRHDNEQLRGVDRRESLRRILKGQPIEESIAQEWMTRKNNYYTTLLQDLTPDNRLPGVVNFLEEARAAGLKIGLGSASRNANPVLDKLSLRSMFDVVGDGYSVARTKPAPDLFVWVAGALGVPPMQSVVFEDAEAGIAAGLEGGFWTVGLGDPANVGRAHVLIRDLSQAAVRAILESVEQMSVKG
ncbi:MAG: beta-phosphoglucomutase [Burkholderiales bacterium]|nr:beta-phosphoglucomutase [Anaerolineae bacterium]